MWSSGKRNRYYFSKNLTEMWDFFGNFIEICYYFTMLPTVRIDPLSELSEKLARTPTPLKWDRLALDRLLDWLEEWINSLSLKSLTVGDIIYWSLSSNKKLLDIKLIVTSNDWLRMILQRIKSDGSLEWINYYLFCSQLRSLYTLFVSEELNGHLTPEMREKINKAWDLAFTPTFIEKSETVASE